MLNIHDSVINCFKCCYVSSVHLHKCVTIYGVLVAGFILAVNFSHLLEKLVVYHMTLLLLLITLYHK